MEQNNGLHRLRPENGAGAIEISIEGWKELRLGSLAIVLASQRDGGLWGLATSPTEFEDSYAVSGSVEAALRAQQDFGYESVTLTWMALKALLEVLGSIPTSIVKRAFDGLTSHWDPESGAYGTPNRTSFAATRGLVNNSCRHSAMGLLCALQFGQTLRTRHPSKSFDGCLRTANWLLNQKLKDGGWPDKPVQKNEEEKIEPMSTAATIASLAKFATIFSTQLDALPGLDRKVSEAISGAMKALLNAQTAPLWPGFYKDRQINDSAFIIFMLYQCYFESDRGLLPDDFLSQISSWARELEHTSLDGAWPSNTSSRLRSVANSISALRVFEIASYSSTLSDTNQRLRAEAANFIQRSVCHDPSVWKQLTGWAWINLAALSHIFCHDKYHADELENLLQRAGALSGSARPDALHARDLTFVSHTFRETLDFILGRGKSVDLRPSLVRGHQRLPDNGVGENIVISQQFYSGSVGVARMGDDFRNSNIAAGAIGSGAQAFNTKYDAVKQEANSSAAYESLVFELQKLGDAMRAEAQSPEHEIAAEAIENATLAAKEGKEGYVTAYLKIAGTWAIGVAEKIGTTIATAAIKTAIGLS